MSPLVKSQQNVDFFTQRPFYILIIPRAKKAILSKLVINICKIFAFEKRQTDGNICKP